MEKRILISLHRQGMDAPGENKYLKMLKDLAVYRGYSVDTAETEQDTVEKAASQEYSHCVLEANLGRPGSADVSPTIKIYSMMKQRIDAGLTKFVAVSGNEEAVRAVRKAGIPAEEKSTLIPKFVEFLREQSL